MIEKAISMIEYSPTTITLKPVVISLPVKYATARKAEVTEKWPRRE